MANRGGSDDDQVHLVTSAQKAHSEEMHGRKRRYLISMGIRTVCLILAIFVLRGWVRLVALAAAVILPWLAVVMANAGPVADEEQPEFVELGHRELGPGPESRDTDGHGPEARGTDGHAGTPSASEASATSAPSAATMAGWRHGTA